MFEHDKPYTMLQSYLNFPFRYSNRFGNLCTRTLKSAANTSTALTFHDASTCLDTLPEIQDILASELSREPVNAFLGLSKDDLKPRYSANYLRDKFQEGLSMVVKHEKKVVGASLGYVPHSLAKYETGHLSAKGEPLQAIRAACLEKMQKFAQEERCVFLNHIAILKNYEGGGLGITFLRELLDLIGKKGYKIAFVITLTRRVGKMVQLAFDVHEIINYIDYKDFEFNGQKPFKQLAEKHEGARLVITRL